MSSGPAGAPTRVERFEQRAEATRRRRRRRALAIAAVLAMLLAGSLLYLTQPLFDLERRPSATRVDPERLRAHVETLARAMTPRNSRHPENLDRAADYVRERFAAAGCVVSLQPFEVGGVEYRNVIARIGPELGERIVVGAHYDAADSGIGADDDASGVAALLELAPLLHSRPPQVPVELVAYTLEEPPYFRTQSMGSCVHADGLRRAGAKVRAMLCLEMLGCFRDSDGSQDYPVSALRLLYPSRGDFLAVVGCVGQATLVRRVKRAMAEATELPVRSINAPRLLPGVDFSDHLNYWNAGFDAVMITDTAFYRNENYHEATDTPETLDYSRMALAVAAVFAAIESLARLPSGS